MILMGVSTSVFSQGNLQQYTPSVMLSQGQSQLKLFNAFYTQTKRTDENGDLISTFSGGRESFLNHAFTYLYGISKSNRINVGIEVNLTSAWYDDYNATFISSIGPSIKFLPFGNINRLSVQSTFLFPVEGEKLESPRFVNHNRYTWFTQIFYDKSFNDQFNIFLEADLLYRFKADESQENFFRVPLSMILSYFPDAKWTVYGQVQYSPRYETLVSPETEKFGKTQWFTQLTAGVKFQATSFLEFELSSGRLLWSKNDGAGSTINFGIRYLR